MIIDLNVLKSFKSPKTSKGHQKIFHQKGGHRPSEIEALEAQVQHEEIPLAVARCFLQETPNLPGESRLWSLDSSGILKENWKVLG